MRPLARLALAGAGFIGLAGSILLGCAVLAGPLGLGFNENFFLYLWFGLSRRLAAYLGAASIAVAFATVGLSWLARALLRRTERVGGEPRKAAPRALLLRAVQNGALVVSSVLVGVLLLEVAVRVIDDVPLWPPRNLMAQRTALLTVHTVNEYHPILGWVLKSGIRSNPDNPEASFTTGEHGVRMNTSTVVPLPVGGLLAVGDSFTAGSEVGDRSTWPAHLERILGDPVVNGAAGGWAADQIVLRAEELIPVVRPHTVIVSFLADDILRAGFRIYGGGSKPWFSVEDGQLVQHNMPVRRFAGRPDEVDSQLGYLHLATWVLERIGFGDWWRRMNENYIRADNDPVRVSCLLLQRLQRRTAEMGIRLLFIIQHGGSAAVSKGSEPAHAKRVADCARQAGIETLDTWDSLVDMHRNVTEMYRRLYVLHDEGRVYGHMSSEGNHVVARLVAERLGKRAP